MIPVEIRKDLFAGYQVLFLDPIKQNQIAIDIPEHITDHEVYANVIRCGMIEKSVLALRKYQVDRIHFLLTYKEVAEKTRKTIKYVNYEYDSLFPSRPQWNLTGNIEEFTAYIYTNIFPLLAMFKCETAIYGRLLQFVENQCIEYSAKHQLFVEKQ